jgi:hypothetical protein
MAMSYLIKKKIQFSIFCLLFTVCHISLKFFLNSFIWLSNTYLLLLLERTCIMNLWSKKRNLKLERILEDSLL